MFWVADPVLRRPATGDLKHEPAQLRMRAVETPETESAGAVQVRACSVGLSC